MKILEMSEIHRNVYEIKYINENEVKSISGLVEDRYKLMFPPISRVIENKDNEFYLNGVKLKSEAQKQIKKYLKEEEKRK